MEKAEATTRATIVLATVKGDVHDIGKNLVDIILSNNGYRVINLGIKIPPEELIAAYRVHKPDAFGLSGLLVKSAQQMVVTAQDLRVAGIDHVEVWLVDENDPPANPNLPFVLRDVATTIGRLRDEGKRVFVHCVRAESRTPIVAASYLGGERDVLLAQRKEYAKQPLRMDVKDIEKELAKDSDRINVRRATCNARSIGDRSARIKFSSISASSA
jgi:hypothetical protein